MTKTFTYKLLTEVLTRLEAQGFRFGVDKHLQLQELVKYLPENANAEQLKLLLAPALAQNEEEQKIVYQTVEESCQFIVDLLQPTPEKESEESKNTQKFNNRLLAAIVALALICGSLAWLLTTPEVFVPPEPILKAFTIRTNDTLTIGLDSTDFANADAVFPIESAYLCGKGNVIVGRSVFGNYRLLADASLEYVAKNFTGLDLICIKFKGNEGKKQYTATFEIRITVEPPSTEPNDDSISKVIATLIILLLFFIPMRSYLLGYINMYVDFFILLIIFTPLIVSCMGLIAIVSNADVFISKIIITVTLSLGLILLLYHQQKYKRSHLVVEIQSSDKPPHSWNIQIEGVENIDFGEDFSGLLTQLRQRTSDDYERLHIEKTVAHTIAQAGRIQLEYQSQTRPAEYIMLIDRAGTNNHRAQLYDLLYRNFKENEVLIARYFYEGDPRACYDGIQPEALRLSDLHYRHPNARLLIVGSAARLISPISGRLAKWAKIFTAWKQRAILTPVLPTVWSKQERNLAQHFPVLPASLQGLRYLVEEFEAEEDADFERWTEKIKDVPTQPIEITKDTVLSLRAYYSEAQVRWIAACAVYPALHWDLTLDLGQLLSTTEHNFQSLHELQELTRLPWFVEGEISKEARVALLQWLEKMYPDTLMRVRKHLNQLLKNNPPPKGSVAWEDYRMNIAISEWLTEKNFKRKKQLKMEINTLRAAGVEADFTILRYLDRPITPLDFIVPKSWGRYIYSNNIEFVINPYQYAEYLCLTK